MARSKDDKTFAEAQGTEANAHAKKLAKEKSQKKQVKYQTFYSQSGHKVVSITVKPNGVYRGYVGNVQKKSEKALLEQQVKQWKEDGVWVHPASLDEFTQEQLSKVLENK